MKIENCHIYDLYESVRASKYPMATDISAVNDDFTERTWKLAGAPNGSAHDHFLCGIRVAFDVTMTIKAWTEAERYHWFDIVSSQSTMHKITKFDLDEAYISYVNPRAIALMKELVAEYNANPTPEKYLEILYTNPTGMRLTARVTTSYLQLKTIYSQRKNHRLPEWRNFCEWIKTNLPFSSFFTGEEDDHETE